MKASAKPVAPAVCAGAVPSLLSDIPHWVVWRYRLDGERWTKPPYTVKGRMAKVDDASTWTSYADALKAYATGKFDGIGWNVAPGIVGIDIDKVIADDGAIDERATTILDRFSGTYSEISPSGAGYRIFAQGTFQRSGKGTDWKGLEVYTSPSNRYLTVTGLAFAAGDVTEQQAALDWLYAEHFAPSGSTSAPSGSTSAPSGSTSAPSGSTSAPSTTPSSSSSCVCNPERLALARRNATIGRLYAGDVSGYPSRSEAECALVLRLLTFADGKTDTVAGWMDNSECSGWLRPSRDSYREHTLAAALRLWDGVCFSSGKGQATDTRKEGDGGTTAGGADAGDEAEADSDEAEIARLADLNGLDYDRQRKAAAIRMGVRPDTLDKAVKEKRGETASAEGAGRAVFFRESVPSAEPVAPGELLDSLSASVRQFLCLPEHSEPAIALWVLYSYTVISHGHIAPTLAITSPEKRCGKSTLLGWLYRVVQKPVLAANITAAAIFRTIDAYAPTLLIDEADSFLGESGDELRGILNSGHTRDTAYVIRVSGDEHEPKQFSTWAAKAIALIGKLEGRYSTLADRSIEVSLRRRLPADKVQKLRHADSTHFERLASQCARFAADYGAAIGKARPDIPESLHDRAADNWEPLLAIADIAGGKWPRLARSTAIAMSGGADAGDAGIGVQLLTDLQRYFAERTTAKHTTAEILRYLVGIDDAPWAGYAKGKAITARHLSRLLKPYGVNPDDVRIGNTVAKGYTVTDFADAFSRYLPSIRYNATSQSNTGDSPDSLSATSAECSGYESGHEASKQAGCSGVADKKPENARVAEFVADTADSGTWAEF